MEQRKMERRATVSILAGLLVVAVTGAVVTLHMDMFEVNLEQNGLTIYRNGSFSSWYERVCLEYSSGCSAQFMGKISFIVC